MSEVLRPRVLVTMGTSQEEYPFAGLRVGYLEQLGKVGLTPIPIHYSMGEAAIWDLYQDARGLVLTGGPDVDPAHYGQVLHPKTRASDPERDRLELLLAQRAFGDRLPILAICRGLQILNVSLGGTVHQEVAELGSDVNHGDGNGQYSDMVTNVHPVVLTPGGRLERLLGESTQRSSGHHQVANVLAPVLVAEARALDEVIEAARAPGREVVGVQWHEEVEPDSPLFADFARAAHAFRRN